VLRSIYVDTNVFDPRMVEQLVADLGAEHVLIGTDYPFDMSTVDPVGFLTEVELSDADRELVLGGNAARLFDIKEAQG
jgi:aminocarboxymuconate-semialdehyde decarboxylase